jgi:beta-1,4-mannooligosaccharide/beta-1,4-mannosyl-N-acetylglucosamine phosphorylase
MSNPLRSSPIIHRHPGNPVLNPQDVPYQPLLAFNVGTAHFQGCYVMAFRNDYGLPGSIDITRSDIGPAFSDDGVLWTVQSQPCFRLHDEEPCGPMTRAWRNKKAPVARSST